MVSIKENGWPAFVIWFTFQRAELETKIRSTYQLVVHFLHNQPRTVSYPCKSWCFAFRQKMLSCKNQHISYSYTILSCNLKNCHKTIHFPVFQNKKFNKTDNTHLDKELYMQISLSLRGKDQKMIRRWTGSGILS